MKGLVFDIEVLYFSTFRKPNSTSLILTYTIPPFTTIRGMIANALGLQRDDYSLQDTIKIGIAVKKFGFKNTEMAKILKLKENKNRPIRNYPSSPMFREYVVNPEYTVFLGSDEYTINKIFNALKFPERPLYLGQSDDLVDVTVYSPNEIQEVEIDIVDSVIDEIVQGAIIEKIPYKFIEEEGKYNVEYKLVSIPSILPLRLSSTKKLYRYLDKNIQIQ
ncbi:MAG: CRISPR-associated protein Cas5 [Candidatus Cloacimonetes bacterium]|nr:CRISPR-associated protein Cas5 [Candidatus Cloacimonadota bacterium]